MRGRVSDRRFVILDALRANPSASLAELVNVTGIRSRSNIWYHLHQMERDRIKVAPGISLARIIRRLKDESYQAKVSGCVIRNMSRGRESRLTEAERIEQVVAKAQEREALGVDMVHAGKRAYRLTLHAVKF